MSIRPTDPHASPEAARGPIAYMARHGVAANLLLFFILAAGLVSLPGLVQEAFPVLSFDFIEVSVAYPGATPDEVEESVVLRIEEQIETVDGVREVSAVASEGLASVMVGLRSRADMSRVLDEVESAVNRIQTFPAQAERPEIRQMTNRQSVIRLVLYGDVSERALKEVAYEVEARIASLPAVSYVTTSGVRAYEISVEVPLRRLRALGLTLEGISNAIRVGSREMSAGSIETRDAEVRLRTTGRRYDQQDFEDIVVLSQSDGAVVRLGDIAEVRDGFQDVDLITRYNGQRSAFVEVYRSAGEQVLDVVEAVEAHLEEEILPSLPAGVSVDVWNNDADIYEDRLNLLLKNGLLGLILVLGALALFLQIRLALWVALGIAISFVGAIVLMLALNVSINTITLFAFILAVGIVIDDAIVVAEQIYAERSKGVPGLVAAIRGTQRVKRPVIFAVLTTIAAFFPLMFVPGPLGRATGSIAIILISILIFSLIESLLILPRHLSHLPGPGARPANPVERLFGRLHAAVALGLSRFTEGPLDRGLRLATAQPALVIAAGIAMIVLCAALVGSGLVGVIFTQPVEADIVTASLEMPEGTPARRTAELAAELELAGHRAIERLSGGGAGDAETLLAGVNFTVGAKARPLGGAIAQEPNLNPRSNIAAVEFKLVGAEERNVTSGEFLQAWRREAGPMPEARGLVFTAELLNLGAPVQIRLNYRDPDQLGQIGDVVVAALRGFDGVFDVQSDHSDGLQEIQLELREEAHTLGLTLDALGRQVRAAFFGDEAVRVQRGQEDVRLYVRLPEEDRDAIADVENYLVRTPAGAEVPLSRAAAVRFGVSPSSIRRQDGERIVTITADVDPAVVTGAEVLAALETTVLPDLSDQYPGLGFRYGGQQEQQLESFDALGRGFLIALLIIFALLAIPLGSYAQPLIIMAVIPFGIVGAILGHFVMGISLSITSLWGMVALTGVVVNDTLVMIDLINRRLEAGRPARAAIIEGAKARFRPILITSLTTFLGFAPLIFEQSLQAQFLIPLGVSMGFGLVFATFVLMLTTPAMATVYFNVTKRGLAAPETTGGFSA